jgi:hypothetical protein
MKMGKFELKAANYLTLNKIHRYVFVDGAGVADYIFL